mgnify:CR=1 FL=1
MKYVLTMFFWALTVCCFAHQSSVVSIFEDYFNRAVVFSRAYPSEKVHLHFDNTSYYCGDTIWFKAYVTEGPEYKPTSLSRPLYVELLDQLGHVLDKQIVKIVNGEGNGQFILEKSGLSGYHEVRAFTKWMLAFDDRYSFSRTFPVYRAQTGKEDAERSIGTYRMNSHMKQRPREDTDKVSVRFFPEGGHLVEGVPSIVAFKAESRDSGSISVSGVVRRQNGEIATELSTLHDGMGCFSYTPLPGERSEAEIEYNGKTYRFRLPEALPSGYILTVSQRDSLLDVRVFRNSSTSRDTVGLFVSHQGVPLLWRPLPFSKGDGEILRFRTSDFPDGILQLSLLDRTGQIMSERLVYLMPRSEGVRLTASSDRSYYSPYSAARWHLEARDSSGRPLETTLSVSVRSMLRSDYLEYDNTIYTDLLLTSDLKGYIHQPGYYFADRSRERLQALDLLLLVHGWRKYDLSRMVSTPPAQPVYLPEKQLMVHGRLKSYVLKKDQDNLEVSLLARSDSLFLAGSSLSDSLGCFQIPVEDFEGTMQTSIQTRKPGAKRKRLTSVLLYRNFSPSLRAYGYYEEHPAWQDLSELEFLFNRRDSLYWDSLRRSDPYLLSEVTVKARYPRKRTRRFEESIRSYYDVQSMVDEMRDRGEEVFTLYDFLNKVDPAIRIEMDDIGTNMYYYDEEILLVVNSSVRDFKNAPFLIQDDIDAIKTVTICSGTGANDEIGVLDFDSWQFEEELKLEHRNGINRIRRKVPPVCYVVTVDGWNANRDFRPKRGIRTTRVQGYARPLEFYSPAYRDGALPPGTDKRRTLYWNPSVKTDKNGCAVIECYNSDRTSPLTISVETICGGMPGAVVKHSVD